MKVRDVTQSDADLYQMVKKLHQAVPGLSNSDIARRLQRLAGIQSQKYYMEILTDFPYDLTLITIAETSHVQDVLSARGTIEGHYRVPWPSGTLRPRR